MKSIFMCLIVSGVILWILFADYVLSSKRIDWNSMDAGDCVDEDRRFYCVRKCDCFQHTNTHCKSTTHSNTTHSNTGTLGGDDRLSEVRFDRVGECVVGISTD